MTRIRRLLAATPAALVTILALTVGASASTLPVEPPVSDDPGGDLIPGSEELTVVSPRC